MRRHLLWAAAGLLILALMLAGCSRSNDEQALRDTLAAMEAALKERNTGQFMRHVADDFIQPDAQLDAAGLRRLVTGLLLRYPTVQSLVTVGDIQIDGTRATLELTVLATGGQGLLPERGQAWTVRSSWRRDGSRWLLYHAQWDARL